MGRQHRLKRPERLNGHDRWIHQWLVPSETNPNKKYKVSETDKGYFVCDCPAFKFQKGPLDERKPCKHILEVQNRLAALKAGARKAWARRRV